MYTVQVINNFDGFSPCRQVKRSDARLSTDKERKAVAQLSGLLARLDKALPPCSSVRETRRGLRDGDWLRRCHERGEEELQEEFGFSVGVSESRLPDGGGKGVVVSEGNIPAGHLVALYPGQYIIIQ